MNEIKKLNCKDSNKNLQFITQLNIDIYRKIFNFIWIALKNNKDESTEYLISGLIVSKNLARKIQETIDSHTKDNTDLSDQEISSFRSASNSSLTTFSEEVLKKHKNLIEESNDRFTKLLRNERSAIMSQCDEIICEFIDLTEIIEYLESMSKVDQIKLSHLKEVYSRSIPLQLLEFDDFYDRAKNYRQLTNPPLTQLQLIDKFINASIKVLTIREIIRNILEEYPEVMRDVNNKFTNFK